jgi:hypothetical protein
LAESEKTVKFLPGFFLDTVGLHATYKGGELPLHISLFPPVKDSYSEELGVSLRKLVHPMDPFDVIIGQSDTFDDDTEKVSVRHIEDSGRLQTLHRAFVEVLAHLEHDAQYRRPYNPHVSIRPGQEVEAGSVVHIEAFSILEKPGKEEPWEVIDKIKLKGTNG